MSNIKNIVKPIRNKKHIIAVEKYLEKKNYRNMMIWVFCINTGLRISDILSLNVADIKNKSFVKLKEKKTRKSKIFPLNKKLKTLLKSFIKGRTDDEPLFISQKGYRLSRNQFYVKINEACRSVGVKETSIGTHTMRKTFGYHHYKQFKDVAILQEIFNHSSPKITLKYIGINQDEINKSYNQFEL